MFFLFRRPRPRRRRRHRPKRRSRRPSGSSSARASWCGPTTGRASSRSSAPRSSPPAPGSASASTRPPVHADDYFLNRFFCFAHRGMFSLNGFVMAPRLFFFGGGVSGKHDGSVQGVRYFTCKPKHGIFVRADKLILDKRGRALHNSKSSAVEGPIGVSTSGAMRRSQSKMEGMSDSGRKRGSTYPSTSELVRLGWVTVRSAWVRLAQISLS